MTKQKWKNSRPVYVTPAQQALLQSPAKVKVAIMGRGSGKTGGGGLEAYLNMYHMPRSKGFICGLTYRQILANFLPPMIELWESMGLREDVHFVVGKTPPANFDRPYNRPKVYDNVVTFSNGTCIVLISMDRKDLARGGSYDWGIFDEAVLINKDRHDKEIIPMMRGNDGRYPTHRHKGLLYLSSQSWLPSGNWVPSMRHLVDKDNPGEVFYIESTATENAAVGGQAYIERMRKLLPVVTFNVEILNQLVEQVPDCFYESFSEANLYSDNYAYDFGDRLLFDFVSKNKDYDQAGILAFSFDFGGSFCCATVHQGDGKADRTINALYRKRDLGNPQDKSLIALLVEDLVAEYKGHGNLVEIWGDRNGNNRQANSAVTYYEEIMGMLRAAGLNPVLKVEPGTLDAAHITKHYVVNRLLSGLEKNAPKLLINQNRCKPLIISIQTAPVTMDFKKDKRSEDPKSGTPQEHATHFSDAFDNYYGKKYLGLFGTGIGTDIWF